MCPPTIHSSISGVPGLDEVALLEQEILQFLDMVSADLAGELRGLLEEVTTTGERAVRRRLSTRSGGDILEVNLHVVPIETGAGERYFIVLFEDLADGTVSEDTGRPAEAEEVYLRDLERFPENGWSLFGLAT